MASGPKTGSATLDTINSIFGTALEFPECFRKPGSASLFSAVAGSEPTGGLMPAALSANPNAINPISFHATGIENSLGLWTHEGSMIVTGEMIVDGTEFRTFVTHNVLDGVSNEITASKENTISSPDILISGETTTIESPDMTLTSSNGTLDGQWRYSGRIISTEPDQTSDIRLKENIQPLENSLEKILQLQGVSFSWKSDEAPYYAKVRDKEVGLIAQEVENIVPEVIGNKIVFDINDKGAEFKSINYGNLVALLIEAVKEQQKQIDELKRIVNNQ